MSNANTAWILTSTALVLFMTLPGLALFYAGLVRSKNTISVLAQCLVIAVLASVVWFVVGYSLSFSGDGSYIGNLDKIFLKTVSLKSLSGDIPETVFVMFQMTFAIITPALIVGAFVERIKFSAVVLFTVLWLILVYAPATHWVWGGGWLAKMGVFDFAGGLVVHTTAGVSALVIAYSLGSRKNFPKNFNPPHSPVLAMIGACMLWVGWFGFNAGSALAANENAGMAMLVTHISAATATITWMFIDWIKNGKPGLVGMITGMIAGLATITPASGFVGPMGAIILGILAGSICYYCVGFVKFKLQIDDSLDVFAVHGVGGILGTLLAGILATDFFGGLGLEKSAAEQTMIQVIGILSVALLSFVGTVIIVKIIKLTTGLRVPEDEEIGEGLDFGSHGESSYNL
ncbi:MAG: ammonium transporter [Candidatus Pelagibacter sp.]|jgi:Amt family ammonium transporter|nr:ammonium transporter [Candidatus Pelagibacter sp.]